MVSILYDKDSDACKQLVDRVIEIGHLIASRDLHGDGDDELLAGRAGFLAAARTLRFSILIQNLSLFLVLL